MRFFKLGLLAAITIGLLNSCGPKEVTQGVISFTPNFEAGSNAAGTQVPQLSPFEVFFNEQFVKLPTFGNDFVIRDKTGGLEYEKRNWGGEPILIKHQESPKASFMELEGSKKIQGFKCKKGRLSFGAVNLDIYYTEKVKARFSPMGDFNGTVLAYEQITPGGLVTYTASKVEQLSDEELKGKFEIPQGLKQYSTSEFQALMRKGIPIGADAPNFSKSDLAGQTFNLTQNKGRVTVLNFWATWCGPCKLEIPELNALVAKYKNQPVDFLALSDEDAGKISSFLTSTRFDYRHLHSAGDAIGAYLIQGYPTNVVIDKNGKVAFSHVGYDANMKNMLTEAINAAL